MTHDGIFISGATGFLGSRVVQELIEKTNYPLYVLVRPSSRKTSFHCLESLWWECQQVVQELSKRIIIVEGDIEKRNLGLTEQDYERIAEKVSYVIHAAAEVNIHAPYHRFESVNVTGTEEMLAFAKKVKEKGGLKRFVHVSTAYVAGASKGVIKEDFMSVAAFNSLYEETKHQAELLVKKASCDIPYTIIRPAQIVGDSKTGFVSAFNTLYYPLKLYMKKQLRVLPVSSSMKVNLVPVDVVAHMLVSSMLKPEGENKILHAALPVALQPTAKELLVEVRRWMQSELGVKLPSVLFLPVPGLSQVGARNNLVKTDAQKPKSLTNNLLALMPYFTDAKTFDTSCSQAFMEQGFPHWQKFLPALLEYATRKGFLNHSDNTVFEQICRRFSAPDKSPISFFDIASKGMVSYKTSEVYADIQAAAKALVALGVQSHERVALVGVNSVRYFVADTAVGLAGAVSVPLYYTSPIEDVVNLVNKSRATTIFVGTAALLSQAEKLPESVRVIALIGDIPLAKNVLSWDSFLALGKKAEVSLPSVSISNLATIRYTSGTTGEPKGVTFSHYQLKWMAETMPAVLGWEVRNAPMRHLSFLPMSHVVEGILVAYSPYYILSNIEMYYLNDFGSLVPTLPKIKPTQFFSIPRFYEKVWNQFIGTGAGRYFVGLKDGFVKRALAKVMRKVVLKKAGLSECAQLIVGSAPVGLGLLEQFRSLGIEIHNAYGVTEAPLIALNRLGKNDLGSVGQLLPDTHVFVNDEGIVCVKGPQVTKEYEGGSPTALDAQGWFTTGDIGTYSEQGNLILAGRKKDILITSYGKNISPQKIEVLLKEIHGIGEAVLLGEGLPFCAALLWPDEDVTLKDWQEVDAAIKFMNEGLSHPEQVKRWIVLEEPLRISAGELTPNLKVRRAAVTSHNAARIEALYRGDASGVQGILHYGEAK